eukprot:CFRG2275T1
MSSPPRKNNGSSSSNVRRKRTCSNNTSTVNTESGGTLPNPSKTRSSQPVDIVNNKLSNTSSSGSLTSKTKRNNNTVNNNLSNNNSNGNRKNKNTPSKGKKTHQQSPQQIQLGRIASASKKSMSGALLPTEGKFVAASLDVNFYAAGDYSYSAPEPSALPPPPMGWLSNTSPLVQSIMQRNLTSKASTESSMTTPQSQVHMHYDISAHAVYSNESATNELRTLLHVV